ncbi:MAG: hypothetical protein ACYCX6_09930 [Vulcanimicrobiaceae bacterium]
MKAVLVCGFYSYDIRVERRTSELIVFREEQRLAYAQERELKERTKTIKERAITASFILTDHYDDIVDDPCWSTISIPGAVLTRNTRRKIASKEYNVLELRSECDDEYDIGPHIDWLLERISLGNTAALRELSARFGAFFSCAIYQVRGQSIPAVGLTAKQCEALARLHARLDVDIIL